jgi:ATP-dependent Lon protease
MANLKDLVINQRETIDIRDCYVQTGIESILGSLDAELVGLESVKTRVREISSVLLFDRIREIQELPTLNSSLHMAFTGRPGTGKTSVAEILAKIYSKLGIFKTAKFNVVKRSDLISEYLGGTTLKTLTTLNRCRNGVMLIDEAYSLGSNSNGSEDIYAKECLDTLNQYLSENNLFQLRSFHLNHR